MKENVGVKDDQLLGRFAPSPTGDLHMGSLMAAVASYLEARVRGGRWLVRMEDLDQARELPGAAARILADLERFGFEWDGPVLYQSTRHARYQEVLEQLQQGGWAYPCTCSRREVQLAGLVGIDGYRYDQRCREGVSHPGASQAWRLRVPEEYVGFCDGIQGHQGHNLQEAVGDFVLLRSDRCWAYQLAVVVDDADQGVKQIVRGADLLDSTPRQIFLWRLLGIEAPHYLHIPVIANIAGEKLSKQTHAPHLLPGKESDQLWQALRLLWQPVPDALRTAGLQELWQWAHQHWSVGRMPQKRSVSVIIDDQFQYNFLDLMK